jgi:hypothetical protein
MDDTVTNEVFKEFKLDTIRIGWRWLTAAACGRSAAVQNYRAQPITQGLTTGLQGFRSQLGRTTDWLGAGWATVTSACSRVHKLNLRRRPKGRRRSAICMAMSYSLAVVFLHLPLLAAGRVLRVIIEKSAGIDLSTPR